MPLIQCDLETGLSEGKKRELVKRILRSPTRQLDRPTDTSTSSYGNTQAATSARPARLIDA